MHCVFVGGAFGSTMLQTSSVIVLSANVLPLSNQQRLMSCQKRGRFPSNWPIASSSQNWAVQVASTLRGLIHHASSIGIFFTADIWGHQELLQRVLHPFQNVDVVWYFCPERAVNYMLNILIDRICISCVRTIFGFLSLSLVCVCDHQQLLIWYHMADVVSYSKLKIENFSILKKYPVVVARPSTMCSCSGTSVDCG